MEVQRHPHGNAMGALAGWCQAAGDAGLLPTPARFPASAREQLYGFRLPPAPGCAAAGADLV